MTIRGIIFCVLFVSSQLFAQDLWQVIHQPTVNPYSLSVSSKGNVFAISYGLIRSTDHGQSWEDVCFAYASCGAFATSPTGALYLISEDSLKKSTDEGNSWNILNPPFNPFHVDFEPNPIVVNRVGDVFIQLDNYPNMDTYRSTDEGNTWVEIGIDSSSTSDIIFKDNLCFASFWKIGVGGFLYKSSNNGDDWEIVSTAPTEFYTLFAAKNGIIYGGTPWGGSPAGHLFTSADNGVNWEIVSEFNTIGVFDIVENQFGDIFIAAGPGVYRSTDDGDSWHQFTAGLNHISPWKLAVDSLGYVYAGTGIPQMLYGTIQTTIPVELVSFSAKQIDDKVHINWQTATELNNHGFEIERKTVKSKWRIVGFKEGNGSTTETNYYSFIDDNISNGTFQYRLKQIDFDGTFNYSQIVEVEVLIINNFSLKQNYPNPFNPVTTIKYDLSEKSFVTLSVYDILGNEIVTLINEEKSAGSFEVNFDATKLTSGIYYYKLQAGSFVETKKMLLLR